MNYPKSTPKWPPVPYIRNVGNPPENSPISALSELWYNINEKKKASLTNGYNQNVEQTH